MHLGCKMFLGSGARDVFGSGVYSANVVQAGATLQPDSTGLLTITGTATVAPNPTTLASVVQCDRLLVTGAAATLCHSANSKALVILARTSVDLANGGRIHANGIRYPGDFGGVKITNLLPASVLQSVKLKTLDGYTIGNVKTAANTAATAFNAGGGGSGGGVVHPAGGPGGSAGSFAGGSGGGGAGDLRYAAGGSAAAFAGSPGVGGTWDDGTGDPSGQGGDGAVGAGAIIILSPIFRAASACSISAIGGTGGNSPYDAHGGGGGGGGIIVIGYSSLYQNLGTISAAGGVGGLPDNTYSHFNPGSPGGVGSVNVIKL